MTDQPQGKGSFVSGAMIVVGLLAARHPEWGRVVFISQHTDQVTELVGYATAALGQVGVFISHPPPWLRDPIVSALRKVHAALTLAWQVVRGTAA